jgi:hypothetical protein
MINIVCGLYAGFKLKANYNDIPEFCLTIYVLVINGHYISSLVNVININLWLYEGEHISEFVIFLPPTTILPAVLNGFEGLSPLRAQKE